VCVCVRDKESEYSGGDVGSDKNMFHRFGHIARLCAYVCVFVYVTLTMRERKKGCVREREREREYSGGDVGSDINLFHRFGHIVRLCA